MFVGSVVFTDVQAAFIASRAPFKRQAVKPWPPVAVRAQNRSLLVEAHQLVVRGGRDLHLLSHILSRFSVQERQLAQEAVARVPKPSEARHLEALRSFRRTELQLLNGRARHIAAEREALRRHLSARPVAKLLERLARGTQIAVLRIRKRLSLRAIARCLGLAESRVRDLWTKVRRSQGQCLVDLRRRLVERVLQRRFLDTFFKARRTDQPFLGRTMRANHLDALALAPPDHPLTLTAFWQGAHDSGLRYRPIRYAPRLRRTLPPRHRRAFAELLLCLAHQDERYYLVALDESAVCPANFQQRQWRARGEGNCTASRMRYERLEVMGALSRDGVLAVQFICQGLNADVFTAFACAAIAAAIRRAQPRQQVVVLLDNAPRHASRALAEFSRANGVLLLFGLPRHCALNPIEYAWEYAKRPFRAMRDYPRLLKKQGLPGPNRTRPLGFDQPRDSEQIYKALIAERQNFNLTLFLDYQLIYKYLVFKLLVNLKMLL